MPIWGWLTIGLIVWFTIGTAVAVVICRSLARGRRLAELEQAEVDHRFAELTVEQRHPAHH